MYNPPKMWYQSWTIIFNVLSILLAGLSYFQLIPLNIIFHDPATAKNVADAIVASIGLINVLLRFKTTNPVKLTA